MKRLLLPLVACACLGWAAHDGKPASFGGAVAVADGELFVAEPTGFHDPGTVHVYRRGEGGTWMPSAALRASDARVHDGFGFALAVSGNTLLAGSSASGTYVFERDTGMWQETARLEVSGSLALSGDVALVGTSREGAVHVYEKDPDTGGWEETEKWTGEASFGTAVALEGDRALVGEPKAGSVHVRVRGADGGWTVHSVLGGAAGFGAALDLTGDAAFVGAPDENDFAGAVYVYRFDAGGARWEAAGSLAAPTGDGRAYFGRVVASSDDHLWVGAPGEDGMAGAVYRFHRDAESGEWGNPAREVGPGEGPRSRLGSALAALDDVAVAGASGAAYGEGSAIVFERSGAGWNPSPPLFNQRAAMDPVLGSGLDCEEGAAGGFACGEVDLVSFIPLTDLGAARGVRLSDVWGWTDPESGREYGLVGHLEATVFVDLTDPYRPVYLGELPRTEGSPGSTWRDIKVFRDHAFIVADGAGAHGMQVFDLTRLRSVADPPERFEPTALYNRIASAHNVVINEETGFAYAVGSSAGGETCGGGLHMIDIRDPARPVFAGCFADPTTGRRKTGYSHDAQCVVYHGPDTEYLGKEICIGANETAISISDVTDKAGPVSVGAGSYPDFGYVHQGWLSDDHAYFFQNDEHDELTGKADRTRTLVWDIRDLDDPVVVTEFFGPTSATDHNLYVRGNLMYQTNNSSGLRIIDVADPEDPVEVGFFDTTPYGTDQAGFNGTWSSYPYFQSGMIVVTSRREGLFVVKRRSVDT